MQIKNLAIGDGFVYLMEGSTKVKFYVLAHNYESGLNGKGRTLFCRESPATEGKRTGNSRSDASYWPSCLECSYYRNTYLANFTTTVKSWIGSTKIHVNSLHNPLGNSSPGYNMDVTSADFSFFAISSVELGVSRFGSYNYSDGTTLSTAARTRLAAIRSYGAFWTRSPGPRNTDHHTDSDGDSEYYFANGMYVQSASGASFSLEQAYNYNIGYLPCFTLPETLYIDKDGFPTENQPPEITSDVGESGVALGEKNEPFALSYTVTDGDGDPMTITEKVNGVALAVRENVATGTELTVQCLSEKALFQQILNGESTLTLEVDDGKTSTDWTATFTKNVTGAQVSLTAPLTADDTITVAALTLEGSFPTDLSLTVEMTNNALDDSPVWETVTDIQSGEAKAFVHHAFTNKTAAKGASFNYKVDITRGSSGTGGTLTMIGGVIG
nr:MAG TPA: hypothetical protein [Caudoviricetes sp.]